MMIRPLHANPMPAYLMSPKLYTSHSLSAARDYDVAPGTSCETFRDASPGAPPSGTALSTVPLHQDTLLTNSVCSRSASNVFAVGKNYQLRS